MNPIALSERHVVVVGGGITGLAAAHHLLELAPALRVTVLESGARLGGVLNTVRRDGFLIEHSADNFITNVPWGLDLCRRIGLTDQLLPTTSDKRSAQVACRGKLERVPAGFMLMAPSRLWPLLTTPLLSPWGKLRLLGEYFVPRRKASGDESLASFVRRRLGREAFERIVQPLVSGIYTADPEKLSLAATLPRFVEMEQRHGSLIRAALSDRGGAEPSHSESGARYGLFVAPREGMASLVAALADRLPAGSIRLETRASTLTRTANGLWSVQATSRGDTPEQLHCDGLIVAVPAPAAARLVESFDQPLAENLGRIPYAGTSIVVLAFRREQFSRAVDSFGFVVPAIEQRRILAGSFSSVKFPGRAPDDCVLVRVFIGGACQEHLGDLADDALRAIAVEELRSLLGVSGQPIFAEIVRWPGSMPQYHVGHQTLVAQIELATDKWPKFALAGNAYHGVGVPNCIHDGEQAAARVVAALGAG